MLLAVKHGKGVIKQKSAGRKRCEIAGMLGAFSLLAGCASGTELSDAESSENQMSDAESSENQMSDAETAKVRTADTEPSAAQAQREDGNLTVTVLNTGKSDCIVIELADMVIMNDTADADDYEYICAFLEEKQITDIDYMILSHFDKDHIGSAAALIETYGAGCVLMPDYEETSEHYEALMEALDTSETELLRLQEDYSFEAAGAEIYVSAPGEEEYKDDNNYSLITAVTYGENRFLLMGDAGKKRTGEFLETAQGEEHYDLIKMPHHGDYNKKLEELFACARPAWAVLTVGEQRERLEEKTVRVMEKYGCEVYDTLYGDVVAVADGREITAGYRN
ncbi:MAG: MBL fold metallo-hydrolase [Lachnospiraceae bacterium]|nr:MBL fold metallo-hydrolase [Lachnospiraceae bacterium]